MLLPAKPIQLELKLQVRTTTMGQPSIAIARMACTRQAQHKRKAEAATRPAGTVSHSLRTNIYTSIYTSHGNRHRRRFHSTCMRRQHRHHRVPALPLPLPPAISFHCGPLHTLYYPVLYIFWLSITILHVPSTLALQNQQLIVN
jgi:hypothetical protein